MFSNIILFLTKKIAGVRRRVEKIVAISSTKSKTPELLAAYEAFGRESQSGSPRQPFKGWELWNLLEKYQPKCIVEMGSGTTSAVFALWAQRQGVKYVCYEHHAGWAKITDACLREAGLVKEKTPVQVIPSQVNESQMATGFVESIIEEADFIYIDGPPCKLEDGRKVPNDDVTRFFDQGGRPKTIVIDGRLETIDLIRSHNVGQTYEFIPSLVFCLRRGHYFSALTAPEHTVLNRV